MAEQGRATAVVPRPSLPIQRPTARAWPSRPTGVVFSRVLRAAVATGRGSGAEAVLTQLPKGLGPLVGAAARRYGLDPALIAGLIQTESSFDPRAESPAGARGLMQLMPATAQGLGVQDPFDPLQNVIGGARLLRQLLDRYQGDVRLALAAYNAGPGAVDRYGGIPPYAETQRYVPKVLAAAARYRSGVK